MTAIDPSYAPVGVSVQDMHAERATYYGTLLATLAYGALLMLYVQLTQVLFARPKSGRKYWVLVAYAGVLFILATLAVGAIFRFSEMTYIDNRNYPGGPVAFYRDFTSDYVHVIGQSSATILPWIADPLMIQRLWVICNQKRWLIAFPFALYLAKIAVSIPLLIAIISPHDPSWVPFTFAYHGLTVAFNIYVSLTICVRLYMMRGTLEAVMGPLHASFYTSIVTLITESGIFFTLWITVYLATSTSIVQEVFWLPYPFTMGITRVLIVLRMAQDRAWSRELVTAATGRAIPDWQLSSTHSVPLHDVPSTKSTSTFPRKSLSSKFREDIA